MDSKIIISSILTDLTLSSKTKFIEAKGNEDLIKLAKSKGIDLPSPDLACFETYYCELDKPNLNNAMLTKKAAEEGINSLVGKQINLNHQGKNYVIGYTIDAKIEDNMVVVTGILFKSLFFEEFDEIKELFEEGKLFVSFELWNRQPETGESIIEEMANGVKKITKMIAHGVGLLLRGVKPACKKAQVFKLLANQKDNGEQIFQEDDRFAYASFSNEVAECTHCGLCTKNKEVQKVDEIKLEEILENDYDGGEIEEAAKLTTEQRNALPDSDFALIQEKDGKKVRRFPINDEAHVRNALARLPQAKDITEEEKKSALAKILKKAKELNMTELLKKYEKSEEQSSETQAEVKPEETKIEEKSEVAETKSEEIKAEETKEEVIVAPEVNAQLEQVAPEQLVKKLVKIVTYEGNEVTELIAESGSTISKKHRTTTIRYYNDNTEERSESESEAIETYTYSQLEEKINTAKAEKDVEIATLKTEQERILAEKDKEITTMKQELGTKDQEIADLKNPKVEEKKEKVMTVGNVEGEKQSEIKRQAQNVNDIIAAKHKQ